MDARGFFPELWESLRSLWHYHHDVYAFHTRFLDDSKHAYQSNPWGWLVLNRPVGVDAQLDIAPGEQGCAAAAGSTCLRQVLLLGNPVVWWFGTIAALWAVVAWVGRRDWRYGLVTVGIAATWLPVAAVRRPADLQLLRDLDPAVPRARRDDAARGDPRAAGDASAMRRPSGRQSRAASWC